MLRIALCDDETEARDALRIQLEKALIEGSEEVVYEFSSGSRAVSWLQNHPGEIDLLFLDVEMNGLNGMETAEKIREFNENLIIVFVTGYADYVFDGYRVGALDYMLKPVSMQRLMELLHRVREKLAQEDAQTYILKNTEGTWRFRLRDILYFYSNKRKVYLVTKSGEYSFYSKLDAVEAQLGMPFIRVHQRFLINPRHIQYLGNDSVIVDETTLPCSRKYKESATAKFAHFVIGDL